MVVLGELEVPQVLLVLAAPDLVVLVVLEQSVMAALVVTAELVGIQHRPLLKVESVVLAG